MVDWIHTSKILCYQKIHIYLHHKRKASRKFKFFCDELSKIKIESVNIKKLLKEAKQKMSKENYKGKSLFVSLAAEQLHMWNEEINMLNIMDDTSVF